MEYSVYYQSKVMVLNGFHRVFCFGCAAKLEPVEYPLETGYRKA